MKTLRFFAIAAMSFAFLLPPTTQAHAQVNITIGIGVAPVCPYGYFNYAPYSCAPFGYYGPQWFTGGMFIGAGPWFHGPVGFRGYVNHDYDPRFGYRGPFPGRGEHADWGRHRGWDKQFKAMSITRSIGTITAITTVNIKTTAIMGMAMGTATTRVMGTGTMRQRGRYHVRSKDEARRTRICKTAIGS